MEQTSITPRRAWSVREVAQTSSTSIGFVRKEIREGKLLGRYLGRRIVVLEEDLRAWLNGHRK